MAEERREFQRVGIESPLPVLLDGAADGVVLDLCQGGFGVSEFTARASSEVIPFAFNLPEGTGRIRGTAQMVWKSDSGNRAGLHFVELSEPSREQLLRWLSARAWTMKLDGQETNYPEPADASSVANQVSQTPADSAPVNSPAGKGDGWALPPMSPTLGAQFESNEPDLVAGASTPSAGSTRTVGIAVAVVLLASGIGFFVFSSRGMHAKVQAKDSMSASAPAPAQPTTTNPASPALPTIASSAVSTQPAIPAGPAAPTAPAAHVSASATRTTTLPTAAAHAGHSGFVLQVGAMTHEAYADSLVKDLQQKNLPAFVFRREGDNFYRVAVGPFNDTESSTKFKDALEKQGLKPFQRPWSPEQH